MAGKGLRATITVAWLRARSGVSREGAKPRSPDWFKIAVNVITGSLTDISQHHF